MKVFTLNKTNLNEVEQLPFKLEEDIQNLVEVNTESVFNLKFIKSELSVDKYRIDTLCFDEENNSFVIIEYKKGSSYSVIDQGYTYLQLLLNNKSDFLLVLSQHFNKVLKIEDVDWSESRIVFISPVFNSYQKDSVNFKNLPFELWEIKRYSNNTVVLNQHRSNSKVSIDTLNPNTTNSVISMVTKEVKIYTAEQHYSKTTKKIIDKWDELQKRLLDFDDVDIIPKKQYISLIHNHSGKTICYFNYLKRGINIDFQRGNINTDGSKSKNYFNLDDPKGIAKSNTWSWKNGTQGSTYRVFFNEKSDIDYFMFLIKQKYDNLSI
jgi:hypothetical protein